MHSMTPTMWKIAGAVLVALFDDDSKMDTISKVAELSVQTIFQALTANQHLFNVVAYSTGRPRCYFTIKSVVKEFLLDESRSKNLYFAYRKSGILGCKSKIMLMLKCKYVI